MNFANNAVLFILRAFRWVLTNNIATCLFFALIGALGALLMFTGDSYIVWSQVSAGAVFGLAIGIVFNVESSLVLPSKTKRFANGIIGVASGTAMACLLALAIPLVMVSAVVGGIIGITADRWISHVNF